MLRVSFPAADLLVVDIAQCAWHVGRICIPSLLLPTLWPGCFSSWRADARECTDMVSGSRGARPSPTIAIMPLWTPKSCGKWGVGLTQITISARTELWPSKFIIYNAAGENTKTLLRLAVPIQCWSPNTHAPTWARLPMTTKAQSKGQVLLANDCHMHCAGLVESTKKVEGGGGGGRSFKKLIYFIRRKT